MNKYTKIITLLLMSTIALTLVETSVFGQLNVPYASTGKFKTQAFIGALPNPVGVGQEVLLHIGIQQQLSTESSRLVGHERNHRTTRW